jgi:predicted phage terminase large subunit-like protein
MYMNENYQIYQGGKSLKAEEAQKNLMDFILYTNQDYESGWFNELLCLELEQFERDVIAGKSPRLMIFAPPRSGKSEVASVRFPSWLLGRHPNWRVIAASYTSMLAKKMSRDVKAVMANDLYKDVFKTTAPHKGIQTEAKSTHEEWEVIGHDGAKAGGSYRATGITGGITGTGMNVGIIDDPAKDFLTASSATYQENIMDWYKTTFYTRRDPKLNGIIIILTRWHAADLAGQLLEDPDNKFRVVSFPMEAEKREVHTLNGRTFTLREEGDLLFPERMDREFVDDCKKSGSLTWNALYQQRPTAKGGSVFKTEWLQKYTKLPRMEYRYMHADTALKDGDQNDYTCFSLWGYAEGRVWLIDMHLKKMNAIDLESKAYQLWKKWKPYDHRYPSPIRKFAVEEKASGYELIQRIKRKGGMPVHALKREKSKSVRAQDVQGFVEAGLVMVPDPSVDHGDTNCEYMSEFLSQYESFSLSDSHRHDDALEGMFDVLVEMLNKPTLRSVVGSGLYG